MENDPECFNCGGRGWISGDQGHEICRDCQSSPTGRLPISQPTTQNIPVRTEIGRQIRESFTRQVPDPGWQWRERNGRMWSPEKMEMRHLWFTIRMIWNNTMPEHMRFRDAKLYLLGVHYSQEYLKEALLRLWNELHRRLDRGEYFSSQWKSEYDRMASFFRDRIGGGREETLGLEDKSC